MFQTQIQCSRAMESLTNILTVTADVLGVK